MEGKIPWPVDMTGWEYRFTFGYSLDVYQKGNSNMVVDRDSGRIITRYEGGTDGAAKHSVSLAR